MIKPIVLNNPPFTPDEDQVIYMEWQTNEGINAFIRKNYEWLRELFLSIGLQFCYLPILGKEVIRYNAPHLTDEECDKILASLPSLQDCVVKDDDVHGPVLVFFPAQENGDVNVFNYHCIEIENKWYKPNKKVFKKLAEGEVVSAYNDWVELNENDQYTLSGEDYDKDMFIHAPQIMAMVAAPAGLELYVRWNSLEGIHYSIWREMDTEWIQIQDDYQYLQAY